jgi:hypothetical protein
MSIGKAIRLGIAGSILGFWARFREEEAAVDKQLIFEDHALGGFELLGLDQRM